MSLSEKGTYLPERKNEDTLYLCGKCWRSQMAEEFANAFGQGKLEEYSVGSRPSFEIDPLVIEVMKEKGIDLLTKRPKGLNDLSPIEMDYLITTG